MNDLYSNSSSVGVESNSKPDDGKMKELQEFLMKEKQLAEFTLQVHEFNDVCWEKCMDKLGAKLDGKTETCMKNCVNRFIDVSAFITNRFGNLLEKSAGGFN